MHASIASAPLQHQSFGASITAFSRLAPFGVRLWLLAVQVQVQLQRPRFTAFSAVGLGNCNCSCTCTCNCNDDIFKMPRSQNQASCEFLTVVNTRYMFSGVSCLFMCSCSTVAKLCPSRCFHIFMFSCFHVFMV